MIHRNLVHVTGHQGNLSGVTWGTVDYQHNGLRSKQNGCALFGLDDEVGLDHQTTR